MAIDPVLYRTPIIDANGLMNRVWIRFFEQITGSSDGSLQAANNLSDLDDPAQGRANIGAAKSGANGDITSLSGLTTPLPITEGGTGAITAATARAALVAAVSGANNDITSLTGLTTPLPISEGGTSSNNAPAARTALAVPGLADTNTFTNVNQFITAVAGLAVIVGNGIIQSGLRVLGGIAANLSPILSITRASVVEWVINITGSAVLQFSAGPGVYTDAALATSSRMSIDAASGTVTIPGHLAGALGGWLTFTPTVTFSGTLTVTGLTVLEATYLSIGPITFLRVALTFTITGGTGNNINIQGLPVAFAGAIESFVANNGLNLIPMFCTRDTTANGVTVLNSAAVNYAAGAYSLYVTGSYRNT